MLDTLMHMETAPMPTLDEIAFQPRPALDEHPLAPRLARLVGIPDFAAYREFFERVWVEGSIQSGHGVRIEALPLDPSPAPPSPFALLVGVNEHVPEKMRLAKDLFARVEAVGRERFLRKHALADPYARYHIDRVLGKLHGWRRGLRRARIRAEARRKIERFVNIYDNMKGTGGLVRRADRPGGAQGPLTPRDIPWAIDYRGTIKLRDGAHRRAAAAALGWDTIPTLVYDLDATEPDDLARAHPWLEAGWQTFHDIIERASVWT